MRTPIPRGSIARLSEFHAANKLLLLAHSELEMRRLGRLVANATRLGADDAALLYSRGYEQALASPAHRGGVVNALLHGFGVVSDALSREDRERFLLLVEAFAAGAITLDEPRTLLRTWAKQQGASWLEAQTLLSTDVDIA
jgi:uncharacterized protein YbgA (DUF1722 family)